jgi:hypothetical protein
LVLSIYLEWDSLSFTVLTVYQIHLKSEIEYQ